MLENPNNFKKVGSLRTEAKWKKRNLKEFKKEFKKKMKI